MDLQLLEGAAKCDGLSCNDFSTSFQQNIDTCYSFAVFYRGTSGTFITDWKLLLGKKDNSEIQSLRVLLVTPFAVLSVVLLRCL